MAGTAELSVITDDLKKYDQFRNDVTHSVVKDVSKFMSIGAGILVTTYFLPSLL